MKIKLVVAAALCTAALTTLSSYAGFSAASAIYIAKRQFLYSEPAKNSFKSDVMCVYQQTEVQNGKIYQTRVVKIGPVSPQYGQSCSQYEI